MNNNKFLISIGFLMLLTIAIGSCKKSKDELSSSFTWTYGSTSQVAIESEARLPNTVSPGYVIFGGAVNTVTTTTHSAEPGPWFFPDSFNVGSYALDSAAQNMHYRDAYGLYFPVTTGTLNITANANDRLSGDFTATVRNLVGELVPMAGSFTNIPIKSE